MWGTRAEARLLLILALVATGLTVTPPSRGDASVSLGKRWSTDASTRVPEIDRNHVLVKFRSRPADLGSRMAAAGARIGRPIAGTAWTALDTAGDAVAVKARLEQEPTVERVTFSYIRHATTVPNDPRWARQRDYLSALRIDRAWDLSRGANVTVAVLDTGVNLSHPDLAGRFASSGINEVTGNGNGQDDNGHGTMVAGIVAANTNNGRGVVGIAPRARILPVKVLDAGGAGEDADIANGIAWAVAQGAKVINLSLSGPSEDPALDDAIANAIAHDVVVVASAGNDADNTVGFPAQVPGVVAVSATTHQSALAAFSSYGWRIDLAAPGLDITSTYLGSPGEDVYDTGSGTSFAAPIVAGVAALVRSQHPGWTSQQVVDRLFDTARDVGPPGLDRAFGHGIVDPLGALGGPRAAPHPTLRTGAGETNDAPADATPLAVGSPRNAQIQPETDEDWYTTLLGAGWFRAHVPLGSGALDHNMEAIVELYDASARLLASQEFALGDLVFRIATPGQYYLRVRNRGGDTAPYQLTLTPTASPPTFGEAKLIDLLSSVQSVGIGDLTGDGRNDVALLLGESSAAFDTLVVLRQTPTRSFEFGAVRATPFGTRDGGLAIGDVDGDGKADVAFPTVDGIDIFFQETGQLGTEHMIRTSSFRQVAITDLDGDSHPDVVGGGATGVRVFWGGGTVPFSTSTLATADSTFALAVDASHPGLAAAHGNSVSFFTANGARKITRAKTTLTGAANVAIDPTSGRIVASRRIEPDGVHTVLQPTGNPPTALQTVRSITLAQGSPQSVAVADVDTGGNDIVSIHANTGDIGVVPVGGGTEKIFAGDPEAAVHYDSRAMAVGDIDGDGAPDVVIGTLFGAAFLTHRLANLPPNFGTHLVAEASPSALQAGVPASVHPTLTLTRAATDATSLTVRLVDAHGRLVPTTVSGNHGMSITLTPVAPLAPGAYAVRVDGLHDASGDVLNAYAVPFIAGPAPDISRPDVGFGARPGGIRTVAGVTLTFGSHDAKATFECSVDNAPYQSCTSPIVRTLPLGAHSVAVFARVPAGNESAPIVASWSYRLAAHGYWMVGAAGSVYPFGTVPGLGRAATTRAVDIESSSSGFGYWVVDAAGHVYAFGDVGYYGNAGALAGGETVTSISRTATGRGYWLFTSRGRVFARGDAHFYGDRSGKPLNGPVLDAVTTPSGHGYYMVGSDGGVFTFGDAVFFGSTGNKHLAAPIRTIAADPDGTGYWLTGTDGGVFAFRAPFRGSMGGKHLNRPIVGMVAFGDGYLLVGADGGIFNFSNKPFFGSLGAHPPAVPIVSVTAHA